MDANARFELAKKELNEATEAYEKYRGVPVGNIPTNFAGHDLKDMGKAFDRLEQANKSFFEIGKELHSKK